MKLRNEEYTNWTAIACLKAFGVTVFFMGLSIWLVERGFV